MNNMEDLTGKMFAAIIILCLMCIGALLAGLTVKSLFRMFS